MSSVAMTSCESYSDVSPLHTATVSVCEPSNPHDHHVVVQSLHECVVTGHRPHKITLNSSNGNGHDSVVVAADQQQQLDTASSTTEAEEIEPSPDYPTTPHPHVAYYTDTNMAMFPTQMTMMDPEQMAWMVYHQQQQQMHAQMMHQQHFAQHQQQQHQQQQRTTWLETHVATIEKKLTLQVKAHHATTDVLRTALNDSIAERDRLVVKIQEQRKQLNSMKKPNSVSPSTPAASKISPTSSAPIITVAPPVITVTTPVITVTPPVTIVEVKRDMSSETDAHWVECVIQDRHASLIQVNEDLVRAGLAMRQENDELQQQLKLSQARVVELEAHAAKADHITNVDRLDRDVHSMSPASDTCSSDSVDCVNCEHAAELTRVQTQLTQVRQAHAKVDQARRQAQQELKLTRQEYTSLESRLSTMSNSKDIDTNIAGTSTKSKNGRKKQTVSSVRAAKTSNLMASANPSPMDKHAHTKQIDADKVSHEEATVRALMQVPVDPKCVELIVSSPTEKWSDAQVLVAHILQDYMNATAFYRQDKAILEATVAKLRQTLTTSRIKSPTSHREFERQELSRFSFDSKVTMREIIQELNIKCIALDAALDRSQLSAKIAEERHELQKQLVVKVLRFNLIVTCHTTPEAFQGVRLALQENVRQMSRLLGTTEMPIMHTSQPTAPGAESDNSSASSSLSSSSSFVSAEMD